MKKNIVKNMVVKYMFPTDKDGQPLESSLDRLSNMVVDGITTFKINSLMNSVEEKHRAFEKARMHLVKKIFTLDEVTGEVNGLDDKEKMAKFTKEYDKLANIEVEIEKIEVPLEGLKISRNDMKVLEVFVNFKQ